MGKWRELSAIKRFGVFFGLLLVTWVLATIFYTPYNKVSLKVLGEAEAECKSQNSECKNFRVIKNNTIEISSTEKLNGIEDRRCVVVTGIYRVSPQSDWKDMTISKLVTKKKGEYSFDQYASILCQ